MSDELRELVSALAADVVDSFEKLDVLVRLVDAPRPVSGDELAAHIVANRSEIDRALAELVTSNAIAEQSDGYLLPPDGPWHEHVRALAALYREDRMDVVTIMSQASVQRLRSHAARAFADAFIIRSKKKDGEDG